MFSQTPLKITEHTLQKTDFAGKFHNDQLIILQHLRPDTLKFISMIQESGTTIARVIGKPNSVDHSVKTQLENQGITVDVHNYQYLDMSDYTRQLLAQTLATSSSQNGQTYILEVGGYFSQPSNELNTHDAKKLGGTVEITKFGHNRYQNILDNQGAFSAPTFSLAESKIKNIEAQFVAQAGVEAANSILKSQGLSLHNKKAGLIGYGMINSNVDTRLQKYGAHTIAYDNNPQVFAKQPPILKQTKNQVLASSDIIFSATGNTSLTLEDIEQHCSPDIVLAAMGSRGNEYPVQAMNKHRNPEEFAEDITKYTTPSGKTIYLLYQGIALNYKTKSCPDETMDPYFSEMIQALISLKQPNLDHHHLHTVAPHIQDEILKIRDPDYLSSLSRYHHEQPSPFSQPDIQNQRSRSSHPHRPSRKPRTPG